MRLFALLMLAAPAAAEWTLPEAMRRAGESSPGAQAAKARRDAFALDEPLLLSNLDPVLGAAYSMKDDRAPRAAPAFEGSRLRSERWETGLSARTLLGTESRIVWINERLTNPTPFRALDPSVASRLSLELKQNLLRHFWGRPDVARRSRARRNLDSAEAEFFATRAEAAARAAEAWLELRAARLLIALRESGVEDAKRLLARTEEKGRYGTAEDSELLQARASLESAETELLLARSSSERARHALSAALREDGPVEGLVVSTAAPSGLPSEASLPADESSILASNPAVLGAKSRRDAVAWEARIADLDALPELSLDASYSFTGLHGRYREAWRDVGSWRHPVSAAGVSLAVPLGFWKERLTRNQAAYRLRAAEAELTGAQTEARRAWRDARETLALTRRRLASARRLSALEGRKLSAGEADFRRGRASTDLLVRFLQDKRRAEAELVRAETDEALALVELARQAGSLGAP